MATLTDDERRTAELHRLRFLVRRIGALYEGRFETGGHVFVDAETWNAIKDEARKCRP